MIPHFRDFAASIGEGLAPGPVVDEEEIVTEEDRALDMLVKHAVHSTHWLEHDPKRVWQKLSERVRGPFGRMAVEEPALIGTVMPLPEDYANADARDAQPDARKHMLYRLSDVAYPIR